ncbi:MAG: hypothetical protein JWP44_5002 [Mucilaginibacter sp.]|nr:hypothetical protein [Mucilaginibacter sp.]
MINIILYIALAISSILDFSFTKHLSDKFGTDGEASPTMHYLMIYNVWFILFAKLAALLMLGIMMIYSMNTGKGKRILNMTLWPTTLIQFSVAMYGMMLVGQI